MPDEEIVLVPDGETVSRAHADLQRQLAALNEHDPSSIVYKRPDLAAAYRDRLRGDFERVTLNHGAQLPIEKTPDQLRREKFDSEWRGETAIAEMRASVLEALTSDVGLDRSQLEYRASVLRRSLGDKPYADLVEAAGGATNLPPAALGNQYALTRLAAASRYEAAYRRAKSAAKL